ncbi:MAG: hypothetical protein GY851_01905 [bacterium]|nr:hypothetical protein [bacterium]
MRRFAVVTTIILALAGVSTASEPVYGTQAGQEFADAFDAARAAFKRVEQGAEFGFATQRLQKALQEANGIWQTINTNYRNWPNMDAQWRADFDAISKAVMAAYSDYGFSRNLDSVRKNMETAVNTLEAMRERTGVPDLAKSMENMSKSLGQMTKTLKSMQGKSMTLEDLTSLQNTLNDAIGNWQTFTKTVIEMNPMGLDSDTLDSAHKAVNQQNERLDFLKGALGNEDLRSIQANITESQQALQQLRELMAGLTGATGDGTGDISGDTATDPPAAGPKRLFEPRPGSLLDRLRKR